MPNNSQNSNKLITSHKKAIPLRIEELRPEPIRNINLDLRQPMLIHPGRFLSLRPGRRQRSGDSAYSDYFLTMQSMGVDLEELMVMEAIRASLLEQEQAQAQSQQEQSEARENNNNDNNNNEATNETNSIVESPTVIEAEEQRSNNSTIRDLSHDITNSSDKSSYPNEISDSGSTPKVQY
ncbi:hypothetical protein K502DRAFT_322743 [Neoconidiobolus thromboides FSU 785]|nr:hypothetical protein K502DRAFT_322743 [Neoconidiobolus thromboides FSU 785]